MGAKPKPEHRKLSERVGIQITPSQKEKYKEAAEIEDKSYSDWVRDTLNEKAEKTISKEK